MDFSHHSFAHIYKYQSILPQTTNERIFHITLLHIYTSIKVYCLKQLTSGLFTHSFSVALCPDPPPIDFGSVTSTGNSIGDTATYACDPGYELVGPSVTTCDKLPTDPSMAAFQPDPPFCHREYCMNFSELLYGLIVIVV